jgi:hypothetical protein
MLKPAERHSAGFAGGADFSGKSKKALFPKRKRAFALGFGV